MSLIYQFPVLLGLAKLLLWGWAEESVLRQGSFSRLSMGSPDPGRLGSEQNKGLPSQDSSALCCLAVCCIKGREDCHLLWCELCWALAKGLMNTSSIIKHKSQCWKTRAPSRRGGDWTSLPQVSQIPLEPRLCYLSRP